SIFYIAAFGDLVEDSRTSFEASCQVQQQYL
uniref:Acyloxyacyl hydrolase n=1 Tax=Globodera pallida TaxID=36090 RepID=A0A183CNH2_GLOPA